MGIGGSKEKPSKSVLGRIVRRMERLKSDSELVRAVEEEETSPIENGGERIYDERTGQVKPEYLRANVPIEDTESREQRATRKISDTELLSDREKKVLALKSNGNTRNKEVAKRLCVSTDTARRIWVEALRKSQALSREPLRPFSEGKNRTVIPENIKLKIKSKDGGWPKTMGVSKEEFETIVMEMYDKKMTTPKEIAEELGCESLFVHFVVNKTLTERARSAKSGDEPAQTPHKNPDTMNQ